MFDVTYSHIVVKNTLWYDSGIISIGYQAIACILPLTGPKSLGTNPKPVLVSQKYALIQTIVSTMTMPTINKRVLNKYFCQFPS